MNIRQQKQNLNIWKRCKNLDFRHILRILQFLDESCMPNIWTKYLGSLMQSKTCQRDKSDAAQTFFYSEGFVGWFCSWAILSMWMFSMFWSSTNCNDQLGPSWAIVLICDLFYWSSACSARPPLSKVIQTGNAIAYSEK